MESLFPVQNDLELILGTHLRRSQFGMFLVYRCSEKLPLLVEHDALALHLCNHSVPRTIERNREDRGSGQLIQHLAHNYQMTPERILTPLDLTENGPVDMQFD